MYDTVPQITDVKLKIGTLSVSNAITINTFGIISTDTTTGKVSNYRPILGYKDKKGVHKGGQVRVTMTSS